jgi:anthranilate synthase component 1
MPNLDRKTFSDLATQFDVVPLYTELIADAETPLSVLSRFVDRPNVFLFESMAGGEHWGRYSIVGIDPEPFLDVDHSQGPTGELDKLRECFSDVRVAPVEGLPRFFGGVVGYLGYESVGEFERLPNPKTHAGGVQSQSRFMRVDQVIVFDNKRHTAKIVVCAHPGKASSVDACYDACLERIQRIVDTLKQPSATHVGSANYGDVHFESNMTQDAFKDSIERAKEYIVDGDIIQVVLSQRFSAKTDVPPLQAYRALRYLNPSPYTFFLKLGDTTLVGSSPEVMVRLEGRTLEVRPIAGTRPRGATPAADEALAAELLADEKERAEHVMLVDLGRNDVGRVAEAGSVHVKDYMVIERYSHVMHIVSDVQGTLREGLDALDVVRATFPAGTLSGAPKIRAMQIINELEPEARGPYGGAVGYFSYAGDMDLAITIRTLDFGDGEVSVQAGAGIVYDSDPEKEFQETQHKSRGMQKAMQLAADGLDLDGGNSS